MNKKYPDSVQAEAIRLFKSGESSEAISALLNVSVSTPYRWTEGYRQYIVIGDTKYFARDVSALLRELERSKSENDLLHRSRCSVQAPLSEKLPEMIRLKEETDCDIHTLCRAFEVLRSTYYHRTLRSPEKTQFQQEDEVYKPIIREIFEASKGRFGSLMIKAKMDALGHQVSPKRIVRLMREMDLECNRNKQTLPEYKRLYHKSTYYTGNKLNRIFMQSKPNHAWVSDITYLRTLDGTFFLCVIIDLFSRRVVGHGLSDIADTKFVIRCVESAISQREIERGILFHSDQGAQYVSVEFQRHMKIAGFKQSFSNAGSPHDNAVAESFFASLKKDEIYKNVYEGLEDLTPSVEEYIHFYNVDRPHYTLGMRTPCQIEEQYYADQK